MTKQRFNGTNSVHGTGRGLRLFAAVGGVLLASTAVTSAQAVALGEVHVRSSLGEPLVAEVSLPAGDRGNLEVVPAPAAAYSQHGLQAPERLGRITTTVVRTADGRQALRITSTGPVNDPIVDLLVQARDQSGRLDRQLTLLVNPAQMGGAAAPLRATRRPAGVAVQDVRPPAPTRAKHPVHKKKALSKARRKARTAAARKPAVAAVRSKTRVLPDAVSERELAAAAALRNGAAAPVGETASAKLPAEKVAAMTSPPGIAAAGPAASGAAALAGGAANAPAAKASDTAPAPEPPIATNGDGAAPTAEAVSDAVPGTEPEPAIAVTRKAPVPAEPAAGYEQWGVPAALIALLLAGGLIWQRRQRRERLLEAADAGDDLDDDHALGRSPVLGAAAAAAPLELEARAAAASPVAAAPEPAHEPLPDFGVTRAVPEEDPVAQADVFLSAGKVDEARAALEEGLWLDGDHIAILLKLLSLHADRGDVGAFNESAARLAQETARSRQAWRQACEIGHRLDPANALYAGGASAVGAPDDPASGGNDDDQSPPGRPMPGNAGAEQPARPDAAAEALPFVLEPMEIDGAGRPGAAVPVEMTHAGADPDASAQHSAVASDGTSAEPESTQGFNVARDQPTGSAQPSEDGIAVEPDLTPPGDPQETPLRFARIASGADHAGQQPRADSAKVPGTANAGGFDQLPTLLQQATARADGGDRKGALELVTEVARLLAALRNEALALVPNGYA